MAQNLATRLATNVSDLSLGTVAPGDVEYFGQSVAHATEHWLLGGSSASLTGLVGGSVLTPQGAAPTYGNGYATINLNDGNGLLTDIDDQAEWSGFAIVQVDTAQVFSSSWLFGTITGGDITPLRGAGPALTINDGTVTASLRGSTGSSASLPALTNPASNGEYLFIGYSVSTAKLKHSLFLGASTPVVGEQAVTGYGFSSRKIAVGNGYLTVSSGYNRKYASFGLFNRALSNLAFEHIYRQQKQALAALPSPILVH